jgi:ribosome maturation factor RimP
MGGFGQALVVSRGNSIVRRLHRGVGFGPRRCYVREEVLVLMTVVDRVRELVVPLVEAAELDLYDLDLANGILQVLVDRPGGADIGEVSRLARVISRALDEHDPIDGNYALEVSTPGLERPLRTPEHFAGAVGTTVKIKTKPGTEGARRVEGTIASADDATVTVQDGEGERTTVSYDDIERARTTFEWGGQPKKNVRTNQ